jgi:hypothetical protein
MATNPAKASAGSSRRRLIDSPRAQRRFGWFSAAVLVVGIVTFLVVVVFHNTSTANNPPIHHPPAPPPAPHVKPSNDARAVAREFLLTAVLRKDLHQAYTLVAAPLKAGESRKEWETGNNPVTPYDAYNARTAGLSVVDSTARRLYLQVSLLSKTQRPATFYMELRKHSNGKWLVDYFEANNPFPIPNGFG